MVNKSGDVPREGLVDAFDPAHDAPGPVREDQRGQPGGAERTEQLALFVEDQRYSDLVVARILHHVIASCPKMGRDADPANLRIAGQLADLLTHASAISSCPSCILLEVRLAPGREKDQHGRRSGIAQDNRLTGDSSERSLR